jgi:hypothetical protein
MSQALATIKAVSKDNDKESNTSIILKQRKLDFKYLALSYDKVD